MLTTKQPHTFRRLESVESLFHQFYIDFKWIFFAAQFEILSNISCLIWRHNWQICNPLWYEYGKLQHSTYMRVCALKLIAYVYLNTLWMNEYDLRLWNRNTQSNRYLYSFYFQNVYFFILYSCGKTIQN